MPSNPANKIFYIAICALVGDERQMQKEGAEGRNTHRIGGGCNLLRIHTHIRNFQIKYNFYILIYIYIYLRRTAKGWSSTISSTRQTQIKRLQEKLSLNIFFFFTFQRKTNILLLLLLLCKIHYK